MQVIDYKTLKRILPWGAFTRIAERANCSTSWVCQVAKKPKKDLKLYKLIVEEAVRVNAEQQRTMQLIHSKIKLLSIQNND